MRTCEEPGCGRKHVARGMCRRHYQLAFRNSGPDDLLTPEEAEQLTGAVAAEARLRFPVAMVYLTLSADMRGSA